MRKHLIWIFALTIACAEPKATSENPLEFSTKNFEKELCVDEECSKMSISYPFAHGNATADNINDHIQNQLMAYFQSDSVGSDLAQRADIFLNSYKVFKEDFPEAPGAWVVEVEADVSYESEVTISIFFTEYNFSGGAHPNSSHYYMNFDRETGEYLSLDRVILDRDKMLEMAELAFRKHHEVEEGVALKDDGRFFLPETGFFLPNAVGYSNDKFVLTYIPYEIGPYVLGYTELEFPMKDVKGIVRE
ncbi:DUF4163 domain-containing protein [Algoriphagus sp. D3-2-R+10]|uniref:DUF4163 domain-containing protein n=1 Tax=Algoriphagus aurantiacus TaxID=3103948 RepID=UPI002B3860DD|nr:DUF4163 domain-containing protein [Algoriphagus sp. D3-2-R+10]MEB2778220.1 DUF4163 domain-containing protein [Algoriphagus sp. D3-2-R+10]